MPVTFHRVGASTSVPGLDRDRTLITASREGLSPALLSARHCDAGRDRVLPPLPSRARGRWCWSELSARPAHSAPMPA
jgi:hypothetical protein